MRTAYHRNTNKCCDASLRQGLLWMALLVVNYHHQQLTSFKKITIDIIKNGAASKCLACRNDCIHEFLFSFTDVSFPLKKDFFICHASVSSIRTSCSILEDLLSSLHNRVNCIKSVRKVKQQKGSAELELPVL